jgi:isopenicillin N synthase-like dioxygenase
VERLPVIDVSSLVADDAPIGDVATEIDRACREFGFFYAEGHGVDEDLQQAMDAAAREFFALPEADKAEIGMARGGLAWRGWFPFEGELTSGRADRKEGIYFGAELPARDPRVLRGTPLHGANLFPPQVPALRTTVLPFLDAMTALGHRLLRGMAVGLGLDPGWFHQHLTADPLILFRIFRYPPEAGLTDPNWGVAEHTDYGLLTLLRQDRVGGLQVRTAAGWIEAPPVDDSFVCNIGDMLDRMTGGLYRSTPHRVRLNTSGRDRLSFPLFFDPDMESRIEPIRSALTDDRATRWDGASVHAFDGTYGDYLLGKIGKVFPDLKQSVL